MIFPRRPGTFRRPGFLMPSRSASYFCFNLLQPSNLPQKGVRCKGGAPKSMGGSRCGRWGSVYVVRRHGRIPSHEHLPQRPVQGLGAGLQEQVGTFTSRGCARHRVTCAGQGLWCTNRRCGRAGRESSDVRRLQARRHETGMPSRVIRLITAQPVRASAFCPGRLRARKRLPIRVLLQFSGERFGTYPVSLSN
jgi:hypothetical protein